MTEAARAPFKGPFEVEPHYWEEAETKISGYQVIDADSRLVVLFPGYGTEPKAQWLRDTLNAATCPAPAPVGGEAPSRMLQIGAAVSDFEEAVTSGSAEERDRKKVRLYQLVRDVILATPAIPQPGEISDLLDSLIDEATEKCSESFIGHDDMHKLPSYAAVVQSMQAARATAPAGHVLTAEERGEIALIAGYAHDEKAAPGRLTYREDTTRLIAIISRLTSTEPTP
jgi:hypothetical protein